MQLIINTIALIIGVGISILGYSHYREIKFALNLLISQVTYQEHTEAPKIEPEIVPIPKNDSPASPATPVIAPPVEDPNAKKWITGNHLEWRIPEGKTKIILKYKEKNGRIIVEYPFEVRAGERVEIEAMKE